MSITSCRRPAAKRYASRMATLASCCSMARPNSPRNHSRPTPRSADIPNTAGDTSPDSFLRLSRTRRPCVPFFGIIGLLARIALPLRATFDLSRPATTAVGSSVGGPPADPECSALAATAALPNHRLNLRPSVEPTENGTETHSERIVEAPRRGTFPNAGPGHNPHSLEHRSRRGSPLAGH